MKNSSARGRSQKTRFQSPERGCSSLSTRQCPPFARIDTLRLTYLLGLVECVDKPDDRTTRSGRCSVHQISLQDARNMPRHLTCWHIFRDFLELHGLLVHVGAEIRNDVVAVQRTSVSFSTLRCHTEIKRSLQLYRGHCRGIVILRIGRTVIGSPIVLQREQR